MVQAGEIKTIGQSTPVTVGMMLLLVAGAFWTGQLSERQLATQEIVMESADAIKEHRTALANLATLATTSEKRIEWLERHALAPP